MALSKLIPHWVGWCFRAATLAAFGFILSACSAQPRSGPVTVADAGVMLAAADTGIQSDALVQISSSYGDYLAGLVASNQNDLSSAADFMLGALEHDPENPKLLRRAFLLAAADGRYVESVRLARRLIKEEPVHSAASLVLAIDSIERGELEAAFELLDALPMKGLNTITVPMLKAWIRAGEDNLESALEEIAPLSETRGFDVLYQLHVALLNDMAGRQPEAETAYVKATEAAASASLRLAWVVGNYYERQGKTEAARAIYQKYISANETTSLFDRALARLDAGDQPKPVVTNFKQGIAEALFNIASLLSQERAQEMALLHIYLSLRLEPKTEVAKILLGEVLQAQDRGSEAIEVYREIDPASPFAWTARLRIAEELDRLERTDDAIIELEALAKERQDKFGPLFRLGNLLRNEERFDEAVVAYDRAFARLDESDEQDWSMYYFRGIALERSKQWSRAEADFLKALEVEPEQPYVMNYLAYSWVEQGENLDRAKEMLVRAVELRPNDGYIVDSLGWVYYQIEEFEKAVVQLEKAVELRPQDPVINDHLGDAYWRVGRRQEARFQWRRALSLEPEKDTVPSIEAKIKNGLSAEPQNI